MDDWAFRRGHRYGTILCDLERHQAIDLLPERSSEGLATWLEAHPQVTIISRDRGDYYIKGATIGSPDAVQVTDRWHLLKNLQEALVRTVDRHGHEVQAAIRRAAAAVTVASDTDSDSTKDSAEKPFPKHRLTRREELRQQRQAHRLQRYQRVVELYSQGVPLRAIARQVGIHRVTVRRYVSAGQFPEQARSPRRSQADRFLDYLRQRWKEGCENAVQLTRELRKQGFRGSCQTVRRCVAAWRKHRPARPACSSRSIISCHSPNRIAWMMIKATEDLPAVQQIVRHALEADCPPLGIARALTQEFFSLVRQRRVESLDDWIAQVRSQDELPELKRFAEGLVEDLPAVKAALRLPWSNGQTEGQVNRLKLIKRQMFGRAKFDLLRQRVLFAS